jgi:hypothetical protein
VNVGVVGSPATLDPYSPVASDLTYALARPVYPSLYELGAKGRPVASLARDAELTEKGVRITLRRARWSDGSPITARDVVASVARATPPSGFTRVQGARALSRRVVFLEFNATRFWERALALSTYVLPGGVPRAHKAGILGGGPWRVSSYRPGLKVVYERNRHVVRDEGPYLERVSVFFYESMAVLLDALRSGDVDVAVPLATLNLDDRLSAMRVEYDHALGWELVWMDLRPTLPRATRSAVVAAINRAALEEGFVRDAGRVSFTMHPGPRGRSGLWDRGIGKRSKVDDPVRIGVPSGDELLFLYEGAIDIQLSGRKIDLEPVVGQAADFYGPWRDDGPWDVALMRSAGAKGLRDRKREARTLTALPLAHVETYLAWRPGIEGLQVNPTLDGPLWNMESWWRSRP